MERLFSNKSINLSALIETLRSSEPPQSAGSGHVCRYSEPKHCSAYHMICKEPEKWFREATIDERDRALLADSTMDWIVYSMGSFIRKITVEKDVECKKLVRSAGGQLIGYNVAADAPVHWASTLVNVNIVGAPGSGFNWGYLSTRSSNIRIMKSLAETCDKLPWDAMILRGYTPSTDNLSDVEYISSRQWDILAMKMCEDYDSPWIVLTIKDAGPREKGHDCQDPNECGCTCTH